jgi:uncharacterized protein
MQTIENKPLSLALKDIAARFGVSAIYVFGSRAEEISGRIQNEHSIGSHSNSDLDLGIQPTPGKDLSAREKVEITIALEDLFEVPRADLISIPEADPFLALDIIRGELIYCTDLDQQAEDELYILRRAGDLAPFEKERIEMILNGGGR